MPLPPVAGTLVRDIDPATWGLTNGTALTFANSGLTPTGSASPLFRTPVFDTGAPAAQTSLTGGFSIPRPIADDFTLYTVIMDPFATVASTDFFRNGSLIAADVIGSVNDFGITVRSDGKLCAGTGNPDTSAVGTHDVSSGTHRIAVTRVKATGVLSVYVDGALDLTVTNNTNSLTSSANLYFGVGGGDAAAALYYGRFLAYDAAHAGADLASMDAYLVTTYGESTVLRSTKAVTYISIGPLLQLSSTKAVMYVITGPDTGARQRIKVRLVKATTNGLVW